MGMGLSIDNAGFLDTFVSGSDFAAAAHTLCWRGGCQGSIRYDGLLNRSAGGSQ